MQSITGKGSNGKAQQARGAVMELCILRVLHMLGLCCACFACCACLACCVCCASCAGDSWGGGASTRVIMHWQGPQRCATLVKSSSLPFGTATFNVSLPYIAYRMGGKVTLLATHKVLPYLHFTCVCSCGCTFLDPCHVYCARMAKSITDAGCSYAAG